MFYFYRNPDIFESKINVNGKLFKFAIATGFRNIQTLVRKLKTKTLASNLPHFIEIMACPTGKIYAVFLTKQNKKHNICFLKAV